VMASLAHASWARSLRGRPSVDGRTWPRSAPSSTSAAHSPSMTATVTRSTQNGPSSVNSHRWRPTAMLIRERMIESNPCRRRWATNRFSMRPGKSPPSRATYRIGLFYALHVTSAEGRLALGNCRPWSRAECENETRSNQQNAEDNKRQRDQYACQRTADGRAQRLCAHL
jgi:hypothetical protein